MDKKSISIREREYILDCFLILIVLQIARIIIKNVLLSVLSFTAINLNIANIISIMIVGISVFLFLRGSSLFNPAGYRLTQMANKYENKKILLLQGGGNPLLQGHAAGVLLPGAPGQLAGPVPGKTAGVLLPHAGALLSHQVPPL